MKFTFKIGEIIIFIKFYFRQIYQCFFKFEFNKIFQFLVKFVLHLELKTFLMFCIKFIYYDKYLVCKNWKFF